MKIKEQLHRSATHRNGYDPNCPQCMEQGIAVKPANTHGGWRPGAGVKPKPRYCEKCGTLCPSATEARAHCAGGSLMS